MTLPSELIRRAKVAAAERDTSLSALIAEFLERLTQEDDYDEVWRRERDAMRAGLPMRLGDVTWSRDHAHARR